VRSAARSSFLKDLFGQLASDVPRIDAGRWCAHNAFVGMILIGGAFVLRFSGPPHQLGPRGFALVLGAGIALVAAAIVPLVRPALVPAVLAADGLVVLALTAAFAVACLSWTRETAPRGSFRYLPGFITTAATYGGALWADFGPSRARPRRWRLAGLVLGIALDAVVGVMVIGVVLRD
jgi:hypothetical protein